MENQVIPTLAALAHPQRLAIFRLLMRRFPDALPAGEIAAVLALKPSTLSAYLSALAQAGLVTQARSGTSLRYAIQMSTVRQTLDFLLTDCCRGRADLGVALPLSLKEPAMANDKYNVLFICTGNSARSVFAESVLRATAGDRFNAYSAGTAPFSALNPFALEVLQAKGHDVSGLRAKNISEFQDPEAPRMDFVFTVCDRAANEECPAWEGQPITGHWGVPDPVKVEGTDAQKSLAFQQAYGALANRIRAFTALPFAALDRISLQTAVDDIASTNPKETS
ncbi:helix-turn-helix domain-containing protein [Lutimaribacter sp. EGI FJ00015]|uniref:Helix-turn-helix domain-containing protein n=1 Tax=Lutimaribacter degradans TaxID=2945989 RepID=A0ACC5ZZG1_9RHOB|nr:helix-turn-helix domain-containing protein [Lutimaribacter sp. EGI FJ00013]MCM2563560.1 helix-turn-helix domain-containing protein [Lutimaribacter sp. EGI FJ00013]MCO0614777.1 helix-turn-helix domain-containing protein [Lutimaribacter sp. EGI FJ00015]MCO0637446.1 helix-turn-helix domain-containing protein [Lutimaribacter sp. EGI FJ00014]